MTANEVFAMKAAVRDRDGNCCTRCQMTAEDHLVKFGKSLHVHRLKRDSEYSLAGCVTLCHSCHAHEHSVLPRKPWGSGYYNGLVARINVGPDVRRQLKILADNKGTTIAKELRRIVCEALKAEGRWPPPAKTSTRAASEAAAVQCPDAVLSRPRLPTILPAVLFRLRSLPVLSALIPKLVPFRSQDQDALPDHRGQSRPERPAVAPSGPSRNRLPLQRPLRIA